MFWSIIFALAGPFIVWQMARQLYTAAMEGYVITGRSMNVRVYRDKDRNLFRNNVVAHIGLLPLVASGAVLMALDALQKLEIVN